MAGAPCQVCKKLTKRIADVVAIQEPTDGAVAVQQPTDGAVAIQLPEDLLESIVSKNKTKNKAEKSSHFYKCMNALLNKGTGVAILHTKSPHLFGKFNEIVDNRLSELISDDTCFADNFEVSFYDKNHVIFRIKPIEGRPLSIFSFNTKLSVDKGLADPTHSQFRKLLHRYTGTPSPQDAEPSSTRQQSQQRIRTLNTGQGNASFSETIATPDKSKRVQKIIDFHEVVGIEAKSLVKLAIQPKGNKVEQIFKYIWDTLGLPRYITAFSKLLAGGSIFYGVRQDKQVVESKKWCRIKKEAARMVFRLHDNSYAVWENRDIKSVYLLAAGSQFKQETHQEEDIGTFSYEQILSLTQSERESLGKRICDAAKSELMWYPEPPAQDTVHVEFHRVTQQEPCCYVAEVVVGHFPGFVFMDKTGPEAYQLNAKDELERLPGTPAQLLQKIQEECRLF